MFPGTPIRPLRKEVYIFSELEDHNESLQLLEPSLRMNPAQGETDLRARLENSQVFIIYLSSDLSEATQPVDFLVCEPENLFSLLQSPLSLSVT